MFLFIRFSQDDTSDVEAVRRMVNLSEVVVRSDLNVAKFLQHVKNDTTFYKAFKNLRVLGFTSLNDIRMRDKNNKVIATLKVKQGRTGLMVVAPWMFWKKKQQVIFMIIRTNGIIIQQNYMPAYFLHKVNLRRNKYCSRY